MKKIILVVLLSVLWLAAVTKLFFVKPPVISHTAASNLTYVGSRIEEDNSAHHLYKTNCTDEGCKAILYYLIDADKSGTVKNAKWVGIVMESDSPENLVSYYIE